MNETIATHGKAATAQPEQASPVAALLVAVAVVVVAVAIVSVTILHRIVYQPFFADESAMIAQSYYYTLAKSRAWNHPDWLHYAAYDHPPLPKYMFGLALDCAGFQVPQDLSWWLRWMGYEPAPGGGLQRRKSGGDFSPPQDPRVLIAARVPSALFGVGGLIGVFLIGMQLHSRVCGMLAAALLFLNPLYLTHACRAMSDSFAECLVIGSVAVAIAWCRIVWSGSASWLRTGGFIVCASLIGGLAALAKLNGGVAVVIVMGMLVGTGMIAVTLGHASGAGVAARIVVPAVAATAVGAGSFIVFTVLNPFMTARPALDSRMPAQSRAIAAMGPMARAKFLIDFRREWSRDALQNETFQLDWLASRADRVRMTFWEGFGRYGPFGPRDIRTLEPRPSAERFSEYLRITALVWFPLVSWGCLAALYRGWQCVQSNRPPLCWGLVWYMAIALAIVAGMIPLNWDRYYLPLQAPAALLAAFGAVTLVARWPIVQTAVPIEIRSWFGINS